MRRNGRCVTTPIDRRPSERRGRSVAASRDLCAQQAAASDALLLGVQSDLGTCAETNLSYEVTKDLRELPSALEEHPVAVACIAPSGALIDELPQMDLPKRGSYPQDCGLDLPIVVINLAHRTDRWAALTSRMAAVGLDNLVKAPAFEGARLPDATVARVLSPLHSAHGVPQSHLSLTRPAVGCFLSHLAVWKWVIASGVPRALVMEDDAAPVSSFRAAAFRAFVERLTPDHKIVFPGCLVMDGLAAPPAGHDRLARLFYFNGTFSYLITPDACRFLLDRIFPLKAHIDHQLSSLFIEHRAHFAAHYANPEFFAPDWSLQSDCYVPLGDPQSADQELAAILSSARQVLSAEGRRLLPAVGG